MKVETMDWPPGAAGPSAWPPEAGYQGRASVEVEESFFCCSHCASMAGAKDLVDRA